MAGDEPGAGDVVLLEELEDASGAFCACEVAWTVSIE